MQRGKDLIPVALLDLFQSMSLREIITTKAMVSGGRLIVRSALNPILWLCAIITLPTFAVIPFVKSEAVQQTFLFVAVAPVAVALFGFLFLLFCDRDKLQSEDYQIRKRSLEMIEQKGEAAIPAVNLQLIMDPGEKAIDAGKEAGE